ncbi:hypothetical protein BGP75_05465 [Motiliproteus sp. MSK22-1]|nr:hypothetical protein BGP75_05465 [Motiliproteus sp. MSK22-1]
MTVIGINQSKRIFLIILMITSVLIGWHIQVIRVEFYNELAWLEFSEGVRNHEPEDGASSLFVLMFGWVPSLIFSFLIIKVYKLNKIQFYEKN